jgi:DNA-binding transcriptional ArsR family regulator
LLSINYFEILSENLSLESKWFLVILQQQKESINKEQLWELTNKSYRKIQSTGDNKGNTDPAHLISSRYSLDIHTARLEGAGLVQVKELGRMRLYSITSLGKQLLEYIKQNNN